MRSLGFLQELADLAAALNHREKLSVNGADDAFNIVLDLAGVGSAFGVADEHHRANVEPDLARVRCMQQDESCGGEEHGGSKARDGENDNYRSRYLPAH